MTLQIHGGGMSWVGLARHLGAHDRQVERFAASGEGMTITFERAVVILRLYAALYPDRYEKDIKPFLALPGERVPSDEAIGRIFQ